MSPGHAVLVCGSGGELAIRHLFHTRCRILRLNLDMVDGAPTSAWQKVGDIVDPTLGVAGEMMCRIDLQYQRPGKDLPMPIIAGRAPDRVGVMFFDATDQIKSGDRIQCLDGPVQGTFEIRVMPDPAAGYSAAHHMEVQIVEVAQNMRTNLLTQTEVASP
jgi:hypothetical protein